MTAAPGLHESVLRFAAETGLSVERAAGQTRLVDVENVFVIASAEGGWVLTSRYRNDEPVVEVVTDSVDAVQLVFLGIIGEDWRSQHGLPPLVALRRGTPAPDAVVIADPEKGRVVQWGGGRHVATHLNSVAAARLVRMLAHTVEDVLASYQDPDGRPVFPPVPEPAA